MPGQRYPYDEDPADLRPSLYDALDQPQQPPQPTVMPREATPPPAAAPAPAPAATGAQPRSATGQSAQNPPLGGGLTNYGVPAQDRTAIGAAYQQHTGRDATDADYQAHAANAGGTQGVIDTVKNSKEAKGYAAGTRYQSQMQALNGEQDPARRAQMADQVARTVATDLKNQGHEVAWEGSVLVVDGRRYTVAGAQGAADGGVGSVPSNGMLSGGAASGQSLTQGQVKYGHGGTAQAGGTRFEGFNDERALSGGDQDSAKDGFRDIVGGMGINLAGLSKDQVGQVLASQVIPALQAKGYPVRPGGNGQDQIEVFSNERGWEVIDVVGDAGGKDPRWVWGDLAGGWGQAAGGAGTGTIGGGMAANGPAPAGPQATNPFAAPTPAAAPPGFSPTASKYTAGTIGMEDIPELSYDGLMAQMGSIDPATQPGMQAGGVESQLEGYIGNLLNNPESLSPETVDQMKGRERETLAQQGKLLDEEMTGLGHEMGIDDSTWMASERLNAKRTTGEAAIKGSRDIDIEAAKTNTADRRAAGELGTQYADAKGRLDEGRRKTIFDAANLKSSNVATAAKSALDRAALVGDRMKLREQVLQAQAELGQGADKIMVDYITSMADDITKRYGIDVAREVDLKTLAQRSTEHKEEMILALAELRERARKNDMDYGVDVTQLGQQNSRDTWDRYKWLSGEGGA